MQLWFNMACFLLFYLVYLDVSFGGKDPATKDGLCPKGWWRRYVTCYALFPDETYPKAYDRCADEGATLLILKQEDYNDRVRQLLIDTDTESVYIGLTNVFTKTEFAWDDGDKLLYSNWAPDTPGLVNGTIWCVILKMDGFWYFEDCALSNSFMCERSILLGKVCNTTEEFEL